MNHVSCDCCKRPLDPECEVRYVVRMEVYAAADDTDGELDGDYDHLQDIQDILDHLDESDKTQIGNDLYLRRRYDLCGQCRERFLRDPMGRALPAQFDFSKN